jgi:hypothetical protein
MADNSRKIEIVIAGRYEPGSAVEQARADLARLEQTARQASAAGVGDQAKLRQHLQERVAFYERMTQAANVPDSLREKAWVKFGDYSRQLEQLGAPADSARLAEAAAAQQASREKALLAARLAEEERAAATQAAQVAATEAKKTQAARAASAQRVELARQEASHRQQLEDRLFASTHTQRQVDLRNLQAYFAQMRQQYAGNAKMLALIDRTEAAQAAQLSRADPLAALGGRKLLGKQIKYGAANLAGVSGGETGRLASAALSSATLGAGAIIGGLVLIGTAYQAAKRHADALADKQRQHAEFARESAKWIRDLTAAETTAAGGAYRSRADELEKRARELEKAGRKSARELGLGDTAWIMAQSLWRGGIAQTDWGRGQAADRQEAQAAAAEAELLKRADAFEQRIAGGRRIWGMEQGVRRAEIAGMAEGPAKQRAQLAQQQAEAERKLNDEYGDRVRIMGQLGSSQEKAEIQRWQQAKDLLAKQQAAEREALRSRQVREVELEARAVREAEITATREGYDRQRELLRERHQAEVEEYDRAGRSKALLLKRQAAEEAALYRDRLEQLAELERGYRQAEIAANLEGRSAERAALAERTRQRIEAAKGDAEQIAIIQRTAAQEAAGLEKKYSLEGRDLAARAIEARIGLIRDANAREIALLLHKQAIQRREAQERGLSASEMKLLAAVQAAERSALAASQSGNRPGAGAAIERGFLTMDPTRSDPAHDMISQLRRNNELQALSGKQLAAAVEALKQIQQKLGLPDPVVHFN